MDGWRSPRPPLAQEDPSKYPSRAIHIIVGFAAGGGNDIIARVFGQKLSESLGQPVIVENKPGGGAIVATEYVAKSQPDGYTLLMSASGISINPAVYAKLPYDAINDFVAVSELGSFPLIMIVNASSPIKSAAELVTYAKANPDKMNYASSSASFQLVTELFKQKTGAPMQVIPYKSANESVLAVVSGQVTTTIADAGPVLPQVKSGTVRALAVAAPKRMEELPDVPTLQEAGADVDAVLWSGIFVREGHAAGDRQEARRRVHAHRHTARRESAPEAARHRYRRQFVGSVRQDPGRRHRPLGRRSPRRPISRSSSSAGRSDQRIRTPAPARFGHR